MGYGFSLGPQFCALAKRSVITLHEFSLAHPLRKLSLLPFTLRCRRLVMTSEFEKRSLVAQMPWAGRRIRVIPIGSNIPSPRAFSGEARKQIAYFGLIMPRKGLEDFITFAKFVRTAKLEWDLLVIGKIPPRHAAYAKALMNSANAQVNWLLDHGPEEISELLRRTTLGYFPFPDGASERRGSLKAAMATGVSCITTRSDQTPDALADAVAFASTPREAFEVALRLMKSPEERQSLSQRALMYSQSFSWEKIAQAHIELYRELNAPMAGT
jgi:glycosyltransferase involved in cell wall biosynthesis